MIFARVAGSIPGVPIAASHNGIDMIVFKLMWKKLMSPIPYARKESSTSGFTKAITCFTIFSGVPSAW